MSQGPLLGSLVLLGINGCCVRTLAALPWPAWMQIVLQGNGFLSAWGKCNHLGNGNGHTQIVVYFKSIKIIAYKCYPLQVAFR